MKLIIAGSEGLIGSYVKDALSKEKHNLVCVDKQLGHDLSDEKFVRDFFYNNAGCDALINLFAFNDHVMPDEQRGTIFDVTLESFKDFLDVNVTALFSVCREFAKNNKDSSIVNFAASTGIVSARTDMYNGGHKHPGYSVSKAAVIHLTKILAVHFAPDVRVNCISPGGVLNGQGDDFVKLYGSHTPMQNMCELNELLPAIKLLIDKKNSYMTGANIVVDGGYTII